MNDQSFEFEPHIWNLPGVDEAWAETRTNVPQPFPAGTEPPLAMNGLIECLPKLGAVLWLDRRERRATALRSPNHADEDLLVDHAALRCLACCRKVSANSTVTPHGPREWLSLRDGQGEELAKLYLLPDTDYLAWDQMTAGVVANPASAPAARWQAHNAFLRGAFARFGAGWNARLLVFEQKRRAWMRTLNAKPPLRISLLGLEIARSIARAENAELTPPLYST